MIKVHGGRRRLAWWAAVSVLLAMLLAAVWFGAGGWRTGGAPTDDAAPARAPAGAGDPVGGAPASDARERAGAGPNQRGDWAAGGGVSALASVRPPVFRVDAQGSLVVDAQTRGDLEQVFALHHGPAVLGKLGEYTEGLPPSARQAVLQLYSRYVHYEAALEQALAAIPPEDRLTLDGALREFELLREVRRLHFGDAQAEALFGEEEQRTIALNTYMATRTDPALSLSERAALAQAAWLAGQARLPVR